MVLTGDSCITKDCGNPRVKPNWYCQSCLTAFKAEQDLRRGTIGRGPEPRAKTEGAEMGSGQIVTPPSYAMGKGVTRGSGTGTGWGGQPSGGHAGDVWDVRSKSWKPRRDTGDPGPSDRDFTGVVRPGDSWGGSGTGGSGTGTGTGTGVSLNVNRPGCDHNRDHDGRTPAFMIGEKTLYGAQGSRLNNPENVAHLDLIVDCAGLVNGTKFVSGGTNSRLSRSLNMAAFPDVIRLQWPDMTAPVHIGIRFWQRLLAILPAHTCVCCVGSHGRTGTALAALLVASGVDPDQAIVDVRTKHCKRAIETPGQEAYIRNLGKERDRANRLRKEGGQA